MTPEELARAEARRIASFHFPRSRHNAAALENDVFVALQKGIEAAFAAGLEMGTRQAGGRLVVEVDGKDAEELERLRRNTCACCGVGLLPGPPPLCEDCAGSYTDYGVDGAFRARHEPPELNVNGYVEALVEETLPSSVLAAVPLAADAAEEPKHLEANVRRKAVQRVDDPRGYVPRR